MRNASKNTIKRVMRKALFDQKYKDGYLELNHVEYSRESSKAYFLFNDIGAQIFRMSKGLVCNRALIGIEKYIVN